MAKAPADQFYFNDYIRDTRPLSVAARGAWMDILSFGFFETPQGRISQDLDAWSRMFGTDIDTAKSLLDEIKKRKVGDVITERNGDVTVMNRRKYAEWQEREAGKQRVKRYRDKNRGDPPSESNGEVTEKYKNVTPYSSSSSSSSTSDLKRLIDACVRANPTSDARLVETAVLETIMRRKGSANEDKPIRSPKYFDEEIRTMVTKGSGLSETAINSVLKRRRQQIGMEEMEAA